MEPQAPGTSTGVEPVAPIVDPAAAVTTTPEDNAAQTEAKEWDDAARELFPGLKSKRDVKNESTESTEVVKTPQAPSSDETSEQKTEREVEEAADAAAATDETDQGEDEGPDTTARDTRLAQRESAQQLDSVKIDVRKQMFAEAPTQLQDADGDPIKSIEDVMRLVNPRTQQPFTEEEAGMWLLAAQQKFNQNVAEMDKQIDQIAEVNMDLKDQADEVNTQWGELLKAMPELRDQLWDEYQKTLLKDEKSGVITKAPVSLERFYKAALEPYARLAVQLEAQEEAQAQAAAQDTADQAVTKQQTRADRSDIYTGGKSEITDQESKEWDDAATAVFGPRKV